MALWANFAFVIPDFIKLLLRQLLEKSNVFNIKICKNQFNNTILYLLAPVKT